MKKLIFFCLLLNIFLSAPSSASPIISGISTNEINIDTDFKGTKILLFGAKGDAGNIVIAVRGPKKNFLVTQKEKLFGVWHNGQRVKFKDSYTYYSLFSTFNDSTAGTELIENLELGKNNLKFLSSGSTNADQRNEFQIQLIDKLEKSKLYAAGVGHVDFLDETLFKVILDFPKNITRGVYTVEIYLINDDSLVSFQSIPIYVTQVGLSAKILDFAYQDSFLYGLLSVAIALIFGWLANYLFARFIGK